MIHHFFQASKISKIFQLSCKAHPYRLEILAVSHVPVKEDRQAREAETGDSKYTKGTNDHRVGLSNNSRYFRTDEVARTLSILPFFLPKVQPDFVDPCCNDDEHDDDPNASLSHATSFHVHFSLQRLAWAIQNQADPNSVATYLRSYSKSTVEYQLGTEVETAPGGPFFPILYFAVERNSPEIVRTLCDAGAQPSQRMRPLGLAIIRPPVLAYAIFSAEYDLVDTTDTVIALLAKGADSGDVPKDMWEEYIKAPTKNAPDRAETEEYDLWCTPELRQALCRNLNLSQRYVLCKANELGRQTSRMKDIAMEHSITALFETPYHIIGQRSATEQTLQCITDYFMFSEKTPLVLLFTGPSGHGKTELAKQMGGLLSLDLLSVDCTEMKYETDMFGPKFPYQGWDKGSRLNNYLAGKAGQRSIVFLDEFEKTTEEVRNAMLLPFESGYYKDRRDGKDLDCSKVIWVLAANLGTELIQRFWTEHLKDRTEEQQKKVSLASLEKSLRQLTISRLGAPITSRLSSLVPFMPFNAGEQAVATYKFMRQLWNQVRKPIDRSAKDFTGHIFINYIDDGSIATYIPRDNYSAEEGARPLQRAVKREIRGRLSRSFGAVEEKVIDDLNSGSLSNYDVRMVKVANDVEEISVALHGVKEIQSAAAAKP